MALLLARGYAAAGNRAQALKIISRLTDLSRRKHVSAYRMAVVYVALGDADRAIACLKRAYAERSYFPTLLKVDPRLDALRSDPRFKDLQSRMNFPP